MRILILLFPFLARFSDSCAPTRTTTPIVCACATSEVALLYRIDGNPDADDAIQPVGAVLESDSNRCPTIYSITCTPPNAGDTVLMNLQDQITGAISATTLNVTCTDGNWIYQPDAESGQILVVSVSCQYIAAG